MGWWLQTLHQLNKNNNNNPPNKQNMEQTYISNRGSHIISFREQCRKQTKKADTSSLLWLSVIWSHRSMQGVQKCLGTLADVGCLLAQVRTTWRATWWWDAGDGSRRPVRSSVHAFMVILSRMETSQRVINQLDVSRFLYYREENKRKTLPRLRRRTENIILSRGMPVCLYTSLCVCILECTFECARRCPFIVGVN